jgi:hypothetical protein
MYHINAFYRKLTYTVYFAGSLLLLLAAAVCCQAAPALPAAVGSNAMALETIYPDEMGTALRAIRNNDKELAAYLASPGTVCTLFVPSNKVSCHASSSLLTAGCRIHDKRAG